MKIMLSNKVVGLDDIIQKSNIINSAWKSTRDLSDEFRIKFGEYLVDIYTNKNTIMEAVFEHLLSKSKTKHFLADGQIVSRQENIWKLLSSMENLNYYDAGKNVTNLCEFGHDARYVYAVTFSGDNIHSTMLLGEKCFKNVINLYKDFAPILNLSNEMSDMLQLENSRISNKIKRKASNEGYEHIKDIQISNAMIQTLNKYRRDKAGILQEYKEKLKSELSKKLDTVDSLICELDKYTAKGRQAAAFAIQKMIQDVDSRSWYNKLQEDRKLPEEMKDTKHKIETNTPLNEIDNLKLFLYYAEEKILNKKSYFSVIMEDLKDEQIEKQLKQDNIRVLLWMRNDEEHISLTDLLSGIRVAREVYKAKDIIWKQEVKNYENEDRFMEQFKLIASLEKGEFYNKLHKSDKIKVKEIQRKSLGINSAYTNALSFMDVEEGKQKISDIVKLSKLKLLYDNNMEYNLKQRFAVYNRKENKRINSTFTTDAKWNKILQAEHSKFGLYLAKDREDIDEMIHLTFEVDLTTKTELFYVAKFLNNGELGVFNQVRQKYAKPSPKESYSVIDIDTITKIKKYLNSDINKPLYLSQTDQKVIKETYQSLSK